MPYPPGGRGIAEWSEVLTIMVWMANSVHSQTAGASAVSPKLHRGDVYWTARGEIRLWRGSLADVRDAAQLVLEGPGPRSMTVTIGRNTGQSDTYESLDGFTAALDSIDPRTVLTARVDASAGDETSVVIVLRSQQPALVVEAISPDPARSLGLAQIVQGRLQRGYADPFGAGRFLISMTLALLTFAAGIAVTGGDVSDWSTPLRVAYGVGVFVVFVGVLYGSAKLLEDTTPVVFHAEPTTSRKALVDRARAGWLRWWVRWPLTVVWLLFVGVVGNKIADSI